MTDSPAVAAGNPALRDPLHQVSPRAPVLWAFGATVRMLLLAAVLLTLRVSDVWQVPPWVWPAYAVLAIGYIVAMPVVRYRVHRWESTDTAVYTQTGWLARERRIAPMSRVQTVDLQQTAVGRLFDLASVTVTTASAAGPIRIDGIDRAVAEQLVGDLTRRTEAEQGDAT